jgi:HK97 family phage prohead protease
MNIKPERGMMMEPIKRTINQKTERRFEFEFRSVAIEEGKEELWVEGYAARLNSPTILFEIDGAEYKEQIANDAFKETKMDDVIFNYNHSGKVMARTRNNTLQLNVDEKGLFIRARLDGTEEGRRLYDEISKGYIDRMSFRFTIGEEAFDSENRMWTITRIKRLYDVSAVDIPAYDDTLIEARKADAEAVARKNQQAVETELLRQRLEILLKLN